MVGAVEIGVETHNSQAILLGYLVLIGIVKVKAKPSSTAEDLFHVTQGKGNHFHSGLEKHVLQELLENVILMTIKEKKTYTMKGKIGEKEIMVFHSAQ